MNQGQAEALERELMKWRDEMYQKFPKHKGEWTVTLEAQVQSVHRVTVES